MKPVICNLNPSAHPPKPRLVLHVGVSGHRPPKLPMERFAAVAESARCILTEIQCILSEFTAKIGEEFFNARPLVRVISSLAEGADRLVAQSALDLGLEIQCPLPFHRDQFERDFESGESRLEFRRLLDRATAILELDGDRGDEQTSYFNSGSVVLEQSDVLITVWDGGKSAGGGGTAEIVAEALECGIPVFHIPLREPSTIHLLGADAAVPWREGLREKLAASFDFDGKDAQKANRYFSEKERRCNFGWLFTCFRNAVCLRKPWGGSFRLPRYIQSTATEWDDCWRKHSKLPDAIRVKLNASFRDHYAWADNLAVFYAGLFRSIYLMRYLFVWVATFFLAVGFYTTLDWHGFWIQVSCIAIVVFLVFLESTQHWHLRFLEYRFLAERLRVLHFLFPLGCGLACAIRSRGALRELQPWIARHLHGVIREAGLVSATIDKHYLNAHRDYLREAEMEAQRDYHIGAAKWQSKLAFRLYAGSRISFLLGLVAYAMRAWAYKYRHDWVKDAAWNSSDWQLQFWYWVKVNTILFPALGAALAGIRSHGEFKRLAANSQAMERFLRSKKENLKTLTDADWKTSVRLTEEITDSMLSETSDWRTMVEGRDLTLPV